MSSLRSRLLVSLVALSIVSVAAVAAVAFVFQREALREDAVQQVESFAAVQHERFESYAATHRANVALVASRTRLRELLYQDLQHPDPDLVEGMNRILDDAASSTSAVLAVSVLSLDGVVRASSDASRVGASMADAPWLASAMTQNVQGVVAVSEGELRLINAGAMEREGELLGIAVLESDARDVAVITRSAALGSTQETLVAARDVEGTVRYLTTPRLGTNDVGPESESPLALALEGSAAVRIGVADYRGERVFSATRSIESTGWVLEVKIDEDEALQPVAELRRAMVVLVVVAVVVVVVTALLLASRLATHLRRLRDTSQRIARGERDLRAEVPPITELGQLASSFNEMADDLVSANRSLRVRNEQLEQFVYVSSHDLKSPLRSITSFAQLIDDDHSDTLDDTGRRYLGFIRQSAGRMHAVVDDLVAYLRIDPEAPLTETIVLNEILEDVAAERRHSMQPDDSLTVDDLSSVEGDRVLVRQLFDNLVANALTYRRHGQPATVHVTGQAEPSKASYLVHVDDDGIGIAPEHREQVLGVFERLHTQDAYPGTGMGLAICARITDVLDASLAISTSPLGGCRVTVAFTAPAASTPSASVVR